MASDYPPYECKLDADTQKKAKDELYEDPKNRQGAIDTFREWIKQQKHIKCPLDNVFLLGFLRAKHFSQLEAREALERFMTMREKLSDWMKNLDPMDNDLVGMMRKAYIVLLPSRDRDGRRIALMRPKIHEKIDKTLMCKYGRVVALIFYYNYLVEEPTQVHGTINIQDLTGHTMAMQLAIPLDIKKKITSMMQKAFPARMKAIHMYNAGVLLEFMMALISSLLTDKLKKRLHVHNHGLESMYKYIPMDILPDDYIPDDYTGPNAGSIEAVVDGLLAELQEPDVRDRIKYLSSEQFYINTKEKDTDSPAASFRKLNVD